MHQHGKCKLLSLGKVSSHSVVQPDPRPPSSCVQCFCVSIPSAVRLTILQLNMGSLTCARIWVHAIHMKGVRHKQVCTRVLHNDNLLPSIKCHQFVPGTDCMRKKCLNCSQYSTEFARLLVLGCHRLIAVSKFK